MSERAVLFTVPAWSAAYGGPYFVLRSLIRELRLQGWNATILTTVLLDLNGNKAAQGESTDPDTGARLIRLPARWHYNWASLPLTAPGVLFHLFSGSHRPDVVHVCGYRDGLGAMTALMAGHYKVPVVWEPMGMARRVGRSLRKKRIYDGIIGRSTLGRAERIVATSPVEAEELRGLGVSPQRLRIRSNGLQSLPDLWKGPGWQQQRWAARQRLGLPAKTPIAVYLGRIGGRKGLEFVTEVLQNSALHEWQLAVVGPAEDAALVQRLKEQLGGRILLPGPVWTDARWDWLAAASVLVLASPYGENFALVALEANAVGTPVLLSPAVGYGSMMPPGAGRIIPVDERLWIEALLDPELIQPLDTVLVQEIRRRFDWPQLALEQVQIYFELKSM